MTSTLADFIACSTLDARPPVDLTPPARPFDDVDEPAPPPTRPPHQRGGVKAKAFAMLDRNPETTSRQLADALDVKMSNAWEYRMMWRRERGLEVPR